MKLKLRFLRLFFLLAVLVCANTLTFTQNSNNKAANMSPKEYVENALVKMKEMSYMRNGTDWEKLSAEVRKKAEGAKTIAESYEALRLAIKLLKDKHAFLLMPQKSETGSGGGDGDAGGWVVASRSSDLQSKVLDGGLGYLLVPSFGGDDSFKPESMRNFALKIREEIKKKNPQAKNGWIIDLRFNSGGNMWAMLGGLQPFLPAGEIGYFETEPKKRVAWLNAWGIIGTRNNKALDLSDQKPIKLNNKKFVVLLGKYTLSSGEAVAIALRSSPDSFYIGSPTGGATTATEPIWLGDGAMLFITTAIYVGRDGTRFGGKIKPDKIVEGSPFYVKDLKIENDPAISEAIKKFIADAK